MPSDAPRTFAEILKGAEDDGQVFFSLVLILTVGVLRAAYTAPLEEPEAWFGWGWKVALFFGLLVPWAVRLRRTARLDWKGNREAGKFMLEGLKGPAVREMPFRHLTCMLEIAWLEHLDLQRFQAAHRQAGAGAAGYLPVMLVEAPGETLLEHTRIACGGCGRALRARLAADLWAARVAGRKPRGADGDLDSAWRCATCGSSTGRFRTGLEEPVG